MTLQDVPNVAPRPTLKTIAHETGLAVATVSRALSDAPDIGEATKQRVRAAALKLGYRPNRAGVRLRTGKTNVIALVLSPESDVMNNTAKLIYSIAETLRGTPYHLVVMPFFRDQDPMEPVRYIVETGSADAVILNQTEPNDPRIAYLTQAKMPFGTHGRSDMGIKHAYFDYDNGAFGRIAVQQAAMRGRKWIYLLAPPQNQTYAHHMIEGVKSEAARWGLTFELAASITSDSPASETEAAIEARFAQAPVPDAIISSSTTGAMAVVAAVETLGLRLGRDLDVVSKEAIQSLHRFRREIIVAREDVAQAGHFLARAVMAAIEGEPCPSQGLQVPQASDFT